MSVETPEFLSMLRRMIRAAGRRVSQADEVDLRDLVELRTELDQAIAEAARRLAETHSWEYVGRGLGITREGAWRRYGRLSDATHRSREATSSRLG